MHKDNLHNHTRRRFARTMVGAPVVAGAMNCSSLTRGQGLPEWQHLSRLRGTLLVDEASRHEYAQDYGQIIHERPRAVLRAGSVLDIADAIDFACRNGIRVAARGQGHQPYGQAQVSSGLVIDMRSLRAIHSTGADSIDVDAGADWRMVVKAALQHGLTPPVLPNYLGLTVGGTLSVGGVGVATFRHGAQIDNVREFEVITGTGRIVRCSATQNQQLFAAALAGQGQCGIITRAVLGREQEQYSRCPCVRF